jgi:crossover junction endodeoxyribonuclease RusA
MLTLTLPYPPSVNRMWRTPRTGPLAGRTLVSVEGREYRAKVCATVGDRLWQPLKDRLRVDIEARMPDKRRRDIDNPIKALLDSLTHAGVWLDDSQIDDLRVWRSAERTGEVVVRIEVIA